MLTIQNIKYKIGDRALFDDTSVFIPRGHKVGFVGKNGSGKTTLLNLIQGKLLPDDGDILLQPRARLGALAQKMPHTEASIIAFLLMGDRERHDLLTRAETATDPQEIAHLHNRLSDIDAHTAPARAARILTGLGFPSNMHETPVSHYSGGQRMRLALAQTLFLEPDLLLLDEPTNYLDLEGTFWLEKHLRRYRHTVVIVSHDRNLLNRAVDNILLLEGAKLRLYRGNYDRFARTRAEELERQDKMNRATEAERRRMTAFVDRFRATASKARQAQSRLKKLARLTTSSPIVRETPVHFAFPDCERLPSPILSLEDVSAGYDPGKPVLAHLTLRIDSNDRIAIVGPNGNGKSTLARLLTGRLLPQSGDIVRLGKLKLGYFAQHQNETLDPLHSAYDHIAESLGQNNPQRIRGYLARFDLGQDQADVAVADLSGGEKSRLLLALASLPEPNLLILDEPTNHLDLASRQALIDAINNFQGAVLFITHDRHMIELCAERLWLVADGTVRQFKGDIDDYEAEVLERGRTTGTSDTTDPSETATKVKPRRHQRQADAALRAKLAPQRMAVTTAEQRIADLQAQQTKVAHALNDPSLYQDPENPDTQRLMTLNKRNAEIRDALERAEAAWLEAGETLEQMTKQIRQAR